MAEIIRRVIYSVLILLVVAPQPAVSQPPSIFFTEFFGQGRVFSDDLDGGNPSILVENLGGEAIAIDWSVTPHQMYIAIIADGKITRYDVDGTNPVDIITDQSGIGDIELDLERRTIYWLKDTWNDDQIFRADMDGLNSNITSLYATTTTGRDLWGLALDIRNDRLWITERGGTCYDSRLRRMALNGTGVTTLIDKICNPHDIEYFNGHIYYLMDDGLIRADIDGTDQVNISGAADDALSLAVDGINNRVYWTNSSSVERINLDGTGLTTIFSGGSFLRGIDIGLGTSSHPSRAMPWIPLLLLTQPASNRGWTRLLGTSDRDSGNGIAVDSEGSIYITGDTYGNLDGKTNSGEDDIFIAKLDTEGTKRWTRLFGTSERDDGIDIAVDSNGNSYITGFTRGDLDGKTNAGGSDIFIAKYDTNGTKQWTRLLGTSDSDSGAGIAVDSNGNSYIAGYTYGDLSGETNAGQSDIFVWKIVERTANAMP